MVSGAAVIFIILTMGGATPLPYGAMVLIACSCAAIFWFRFWDRRRPGPGWSETYPDATVGVRSWATSRARLLI